MKIPKKLILCLAVLCFIILMITGVLAVSAVSAVQDVTLNGKSSVDVKSRQKVSVAVTASVASGSWKKTQYRIGTGNYVCLSAPNPDYNSGTHIVSFNVTSPLNKGDYDFQAWMCDNACNAQNPCSSNTLIFSNPNGIHVVSKCGDSIVDSGEICDSNSQACTTSKGYAGTQSCKSSCSVWNACITTEKCGDGVVNGPEQCDDGNKTSGDGCSSTCLNETAYYRDKDNDGYGNTAKKRFALNAPAGYVFRNGDCNDANANINPGMAESCNGVDDNCDGQTDEGVKTTFYADADVDSYGNSAISTDTCIAPSGYVSNSNDCDDSSAAVNPISTEVCNGIDDNCAAGIDEGYNVGESCFSSSNTCGDTNAGSYVCSADGLSTLCNAVQPLERPSWNQACTSSANSCGDTASGLTNCDGSCLASTPSERPSWNQACTSSANSCGDTASGLYVCSGNGVTCNAETPTASDSDSDGTADCNDACVNDPFKIVAGICGCGVAETDTDSDGTPDCIASDSNCDGVDNNGKDGIDESYVPTATTCGTGACASTGLMQCVEGIEIDSCIEGIPSEETCNNIDDNCNGQIDDAGRMEPQGISSFRVFDYLTQSCYTGPEGTSGVGICQSGLQTCTEGNWDSCSGEILPATEICDGKDNNCDSNVDENFTDTDLDGLKDCVDPDNDNDGIADASDHILGDSSNINSDITGLVFNVNGEANKDTFTGIGNVTITENGTVILEFEYDFSSSNVLNIRGIVLVVKNVTIIADSVKAGGAIIIKGINLTALGKTKSAYVNRVLSTNQLCIIDNEVDSIVIEGDCLNGIKLSCPGTSKQYSCEVVDNGARYKVSGLKHSAVSEYIYIAPATSPATSPVIVATGGSSGELIVVPHNVPKPVEEAPAEEVEEPVIEENIEEPIVEQPATEEPLPVELNSRLGAITGRVTNSIKNSPGAWGSGMGLGIAILLITSIYISTKKVNKKFFKN